MGVLLLSFVFLLTPLSKAAGDNSGIIFFGLLLLSGAVLGGVFDRIQWSGSKWAGMGLLILAVLFLLSPLPDASPYGVFLFVGLLLPGMALVTGLLGTPADVAAMRRSHATTGGGRIVPAGVIAAPRVFRYPVPRAGAIVIALMGLAFIVGGIGLGVALWNDPMKDPAGVHPPHPDHAYALFMGGFLACAGLGFIWYIVRWVNVGIHVEPSGLTARTLTGHVAMPWTDILALKEVRVQTVVQGECSMFQVYSSRQKLNFEDRLADAGELCALIAAATGLDWE